MPHNPFTECETAGARITSSFWHVEAKNATQAKRIAEIIQAAYIAGQRDKMNEIRLVLLGPDVEETTQ
jgi:cellobiose-specific phosphotransferase system component IIB